MELFDFVKVLFSKSDQYDKMKDHEKVKFFFMIQRFMHIEHPVQANMFNHIRANQARVLDYWHNSLLQRYNGVPDWIYAKTKKTVAEKKASKVPSDEAIQMYLNRYGYSKKQLDDSIRLIGTESTYAPIFKIDKLIKAAE